jgi:hypothetical protein
MKKYDNIEQQITEGFWDALVNKAKEVGLTTKAALGNKKAAGQLDTHTLATELYNQFKMWAGRVGAKGTRNDVADFLIHQVNLGMDFVNQELKIKYNGPAPEAQGGQPQQPQAQHGGNSYDSLVGTSSTGSSSSDSEGASGTYEPAPDEFQPNTANVKRFMKSAEYKEFLRQRDASGYNDSPAVPFTKNPDGTFVFADEDKEEELKDLIQVVNAKPAETTEEMKREAFFVTWEEFKAKVPGASRIPAGSEEEADLFRRSCVRALELYGKNHPKALNRFILAIPSETPTKAATRDTLTMVESQINEDAEDAALRKLFVKIAQDAIRSGAFRHAAQGYADHLRQGGQFYGNYQATPGQNAPQAPQEEDLLTKAKQLGDYLGISLSKWDLREFRNKNKQMFYDFMTDLKNEDPNNWDQNFIKHCQKIFNIKGEIPGEKGQEHGKQQAGVSNVGKGQDAANDSDETSEGRFINVRGEHVKWDEKQGTLTVATKDERNGGKVITRVYEPLAGGGWVERGNGKQFSAQNGFATKLTDLQDEYMKATGMSKPQEVPAADEDDGSIPFNATVKANGGTYTFNGSEWKTAEGQPVTSQKSIDWLNDQYEKQKNGAPEPMQPARQDTQSAPDDAPDDWVGVVPSRTAQPAQPAKPAEPVEPAKPAQPAQAANAQEPKQADKTNDVPMNATFRIPKTNRVLQRKADGWVDSKGNKVTNPSQIEILDRGWKQANGRKD